MLERLIYISHKIMLSLWGYRFNNQVIEKFYMVIKCDKNKQFVKKMHTM
ncbi:protein of unknown function [Tepidibacter aestuarii]|nr:protein of unknown function [Tepidibacter aestuarii]